MRHRGEVGELGLRGAADPDPEEALVEVELNAIVRPLEGFDVQVSFDIDLAWESGRSPSRLEPHVEETVYRLVQEALSNIARHSGAKRAHVSVTEPDGSVELEVRDEGVGFAVDGSSGGFGLVGMRERAALADGTLNVVSSPGKGTTVHASIPALHVPAATQREAS